MSDSPENRLADHDVTSVGGELNVEELLATAMQEVCDAVEAERPVDRKALLERYPEIESELISCLDNLDFINQIAPQLGDRGNGNASPGVQPLATLGDFRIVRELGRGGMGVVYEAEQLSLGRSVALKVLPFAGMLDSKQLQRFKNEARAAATLSHPNIVPVYFVGTERSVNFYAMQLIEGQSLAEVIRDMRLLDAENATSTPRDVSDVGSQLAAGSPRTPEVQDGSQHRTETHPGLSSQEFSIQTTSSKSTIHDGPEAAISTEREKGRTPFYRSVASLGVQAAEALAHAHEMGVIHRDVKPGNLMVDAAGKLWVTDFGLARVEGNVGMTVTGDLLGTLRYMAPERAWQNA